MKILLLGGTGQIGWELQRSLAVMGNVVVASRGQCDSLDTDLARPGAMVAAIRSLAPDVIVNAAAYTSVDRAEEERQLAHVVNALAPAAMAAAAADSGALLVHFSTDYVFDGSGVTAWREDDRASPLNWYGHSKLAGEQAIRESGCSHLIVRTAWVYAARGCNFLRTMLRLAAERERLAIVADQHGTPTGAELVADVTAVMLRRAVSDLSVHGTYHLTAGGVTTWHGFASHLVATARGAGMPVRVPDDAIDRIASADYPTPAVRPLNSRLDTTRLRETFNVALPDWRSGVQRAVTELAACPAAT